MKKMLKKLLKFLQLVDREGNLSITNIAMIVLITKLAVLSQFTMTEVSAFLLALLNYSHKRMESNKFSKKEMEQKIGDVLNTKR